MIKGGWIKRLMTTGIVMVSISACVSVPVSLPSTAEATLPATVNLPTATVYLPSVTPEAEAAATSGTSEYSAKQWDLINNDPGLKERIRVMGEWVNFWGTAADPAVSLAAWNEGKISTTVIWAEDHPEDPAMALVVIEGVEFGTWVLPPINIKNGGVMALVPDYEPKSGIKIDKSLGHENIPGLGPLRVLAVDANNTWTVKNVGGVITRADLATGQVLATVDWRSGEWVEVMYWAGSFESVIKDPEMLRKINEANMAPEQIYSNMNEFMNIPEAVYREWVTQHSYYGKDPTYISAYDADGHRLEDGETVKRLGLLYISKMDSAIGNYHLLTIQGVVLGTQYVFNETRGMVQSYVYLGVEDGTGNRGIIRCFLGDYDYLGGWAFAEETADGHRSGDIGEMTYGSIISVMEDMEHRVGDALVVQIATPITSITPIEGMKPAGLYMVELLTGESGEKATLLEIQLTESYKTGVPVPLPPELPPYPIVSTSDLLDDAFLVNYSLHDKQIYPLFEVQN